MSEVITNTVIHLMTDGWVLYLTPGPVVTVHISLAVK